MLTEVERADRLGAWLAPRLDTGHVEVSGLGHSGTGNSNETVTFTASWGDRSKQFVVRIQPGPDSLFLRPSVAREGRVIQAVEAAGTVPVPHVVDIEQDPTVLGSPFFVMDLVEGRVLYDVPSYHRRGWLLDVSPTERAFHWDEALKAMVDVSRITGVPELASPGKQPVRAVCEGVRETLDWAAQGRDVGLLELGVAWLEDNLPDRDDDSLSWGDARPGNMLFTPTGKVAAVIDWELAVLGPAELDLAWWLFMEDLYGRRAGFAPLEGVPVGDPVIARWEELIDRPAQDLLWCKVHAAVRMSLVMVRSRDQQVGRGLMGPDATTHLYNPSTQLLAEYLGEPVPDLSPHFLDLMRAMRDEKVAKEAAKAAQA